MARVIVKSDDGKVNFFDSSKVTIGLDSGMEFQFLIAEDHVLVNGGFAQLDTTQVSSTEVIIHRKKD